MSSELFSQLKLLTKFDLSLQTVSDLLELPAGFWQFYCLSQMFCPALILNLQVKILGHSPLQ